MIRGAPADERADIRAAGMLLYEMLLGRPAYPGTPDEALRAIAQGPPAPLRALAPSLPPLLFDVVESALAYDPTRRFASAAAHVASE